MFDGIIYAYKCSGKTEAGTAVELTINAEIYEGKKPHEIFASLCEDRDEMDEMLGEQIDWSDFRFVMADPSGVLG